MTAAPILSARSISKTFGSTRALRDFSIDVTPGSVHGLLGHNGSGKSTFIKVLGGFHQPDPGGEVRINGEQVGLPIGARDPATRAISILHQNLALVDSLSVLDNLRIGQWSEEGPLQRIPWRIARQEARDLLKRFDLAVDPDRPVAGLPGGERSILAIARALAGIERAHGAGLLILDEATAALPDDQVERLFGAIRRVTADGNAVLFVSHRLDEVMTVTDRVTVLRDGQLAGSEATDALDERSLVRMIVGRDLATAPVPAPPPEREGPVVLEVEKLSGSVLRELSFDVRAGEIVGVTGLLGMGQDELPGLLFGAVPAEGEVRVHGRRVGGGPRSAIRAGIALVPGDRLREGGVAEATVLENVTLAKLSRYFRRGWIDRAAELRAGAALTERYAVRPRSPQSRFGELSGGNQQKALIGKWLEQEPAVLVLHEPAHGVDIEARREIFANVATAAARGMAIVVVSTEHDELAQVAGRVLVVYDGMLRTELTGSRLEEETIAAACFGHATSGMRQEAL